MQVMEKHVVVKKPKMGIMGTIRNSLLEMTPANGSAETEDLHKGGWAIPIVIVKNLAFVALLIALTVTNTLSNMDKKFLSLSGNIKGTQICEAVPNPLSASFTGDRFGKWDSNSKFDPAAGFYVLKFGGSEVDNATYADVNWYNGCCLVGHVDSPTGLVPHFFGDDHASGVIEHIILHLALDKLTSLKLNSNSWGYGGSRNVDDNLNPVG
jgi:hypothetical protein